MYVDIVPNRKSPPAILIRKSVRIGPNKVQKITLANISKLPMEVVEQLRVILRGGTAVERVQEAFEQLSNRPHGHVAAVLGTMEQLGFPALLGRRNTRKRRLVMGLIAARVLNPVPKLATRAMLDVRTASDTLNEELQLKRVDQNDLYEAMDWLYARKDAIETGLADTHLAEGSMVLCDVTSSYVEGKHNELADYGYNRDGKRGKKQIVIGLLTDRDGCPVATEVFEGNTSDPRTVSAQVTRLQETFGLRHVVMVGDRGLLTGTRLQADLVPAGLDWITALRHGSIRKIVEPDAVQLDLFDETGLMELTSDHYPGERIVLCRNPVRAHRSQNQREALLEKTEQALDKIVQATRRKRRPLHDPSAIGLRVGQVIGRYQMRKHFGLDIQEGHFRYARNEASIAREQALDGLYAIRTSLEEEPEAAEVVAHYKRLSAVEAAFRALKTVSLKVRPIHHRTEERVRSHVFLCMLAYYVEFHLRKSLAPMLFADDDPDGKAAKRKSVVESSERSDAAEEKARTKKTDHGLPAMSYSSLMDHLKGACRAEVVPRITMDPAHQVHMYAPLTPHQAHAFKLLGIKFK